MERGFVSLNVAVLAIGDALTIADEPPAQLIVDRFTTAGHKVIYQAVVGDLLQAIRAKFLEWIADPAVDVILAIAGTRTEHGAAALAPLVTKPLVGFSDLFRYMTFEEIGTAAMLVDADAAQCKSTFVFLLPSSIGAVRTALDRLILPQMDYRTKPANLVMRMPRVAHVETREAAAPEPWITPKKPTSQIAGVPAPARPPQRAGTIPPPLPSVSVVRKVEAVPHFVAKEKTNVGPAPAPASRPKISATISTPLPQRAPAAPAPFVEELEATPPKTREFESAEMTSPVPRTPTPSVMVDEALSQPLPVVERTRPITRNTSRPIDVRADSDDEGFTTYVPNRGMSRKLVVAWVSIAIAAAAMILLFLLMREPDQDARASVEPPPGDRVAARTTVPETRIEPPIAPPPEPVVVVPPDAPVDNEIDMPLEPEPVKEPVVAKPPKQPVVAKTPAVAKPPKEPELAPVTVENGCDEVSCALDRYEQACCAKYKPAEESVKPTPKSDVPEKIDRAMIVEGVGRVKPAVVRCGEVHGARGTVKLQVKVSADGKVDGVTVATTPDEQLGTCVASAVQKATFGKTQNGGSFGYPFVF